MRRSASMRARNFKQGMGFGQVEGLRTGLRTGDQEDHLVSLGVSAREGPMSRIPGRLLTIGALASLLLWAAPSGAHQAGGPGRDSIPGTSWTVADWRILEERVRWGEANRLDGIDL